MLIVKASTRRWGKILYLICSENDWRSVVDYVSADLIISTGGTYLVESYNIDGRIAELLKDIELGNPPVLFTQSLGPFNDRSQHEQLKKIFSASPLVLLRDERSLRNLLDLGISSGSTHVVADSAFWFAKAVKEMNDSPVQSGNGARIGRVAISVREWHVFKGESREAGNERYRNAIKALATLLVEEWGAEVCFVSTCQGIPEYWTDDSQVADKIAEALPEVIRRRTVVDKSFRRPSELMEYISEFDLVVSTRLHMAILSLCAGVPVLPIAYEFKTKEVFESFDQGRWVSEIDEIDAEAFTILAREFLKSLPRIAEEQRRGTIRQYESASRVVEILRQAFPDLVAGAN